MIMVVTISKYGCSACGAEFLDRSAAENHETLLSGATKPRGYNVGNEAYLPTEFIGHEDNPRYAKVRITAGFTDRAGHRHSYNVVLAETLHIFDINGAEVNKGTNNPNTREMRFAYGVPEGRLLRERPE